MTVCMCNYVYAYYNIIIVKRSLSCCTVGVVFVCLVCCRLYILGFVSILIIASFSCCMNTVCIIRAIILYILMKLLVKFSDAYASKFL